MSKIDDKAQLAALDLPAALMRLTRIVALAAVKGESQKDKILTLTAAGFTASEIAELLGTTANTMSVTVYQSKRKQPTQRRTQKKPTGRD